MSLVYALQPSAPKVAPGQSLQFQAVFGAAPYAYSVIAGGSGGTISASGLYTAPNLAAGADTIQATDANGIICTTVVTIQNPALVVSGDTPVIVGGSFTVVPSGGTAPYSFLVLPGSDGGTIDPVSGLYEAPVLPGFDTIQVTDFFGQTAEFDIVVQAAQLQLVPGYLAIAQNLSVPFQAAGGTPIVSADPVYLSGYRYSVQSGPGYIDQYTGVFTSEGETGIATVRATDANGAFAESQVLIGTPLQLFCDVLQQQLPLAPGRVWLWDQKVNEPTDLGMFIVVRVLNPRCFGNTNAMSSDDIGATQIQSSYMSVQLQVEVKSRSTEALDRLGAVIQALNSIYSQQQQEMNSFKIFPVSKNIVDMSGEDGAAIPYRFVLSVTLQYTESTTTRAAPYFDTFQTASVTLNP